MTYANETVIKKKGQTLIAIICKLIKLGLFKLIQEFYTTGGFLIF